MVFSIGVDRIRAQPKLMLSSKLAVTSVPGSSGHSILLARRLVSAVPRFELGSILVEMLPS